MKRIKKDQKMTGMGKRILGGFLSLLLVFSMLIPTGATVKAIPEYTPDESISGPTVSWDGKGISWTSVEGATGYKVALWVPGDGYLTEEVVDASLTSQDFKDFIDDHGEDRYGANVYT